MKKKTKKKPVVLPKVERLLRYFNYHHLPVGLQEISKPFCDLATQMVGLIGATDDPAELTAGLRKLLEAKDCCVRAALSCPEELRD